MTLGILSCRPCDPDKTSQIRSITPDLRRFGDHHGCVGIHHPVDRTTCASLRGVLFRRTIGTGCILCMAQDTYPVSERAWALPVWAV